MDSVLSMCFLVYRSNTELAYSRTGLTKARYAFSLSCVELILRLHLRNTSVLFAIAVMGLDVVIPANFLVNGDARILCRCHTGKCLTVYLTVKVKYLFVFRDKQPGTLCRVEGHVQALHPFCESHEVLL